MRGYPGSRGTGGAVGVNLNQPPSNQTTFETTEPLRDPELPAGGIRLTDISWNIAGTDDCNPPLQSPNFGMLEKRGVDCDPMEGPAPLELNLLNEERVGKCDFVVTDVQDAGNISLRSLKYSDGFKKLEEDMKKFYNSHAYVNAPLRMIDVHENGHYAAEIDLKNEGRFVWARVKVNDSIHMERERRPINVLALDYGYETSVMPEKLSILKKCFRDDLSQVGLVAQMKCVEKTQSDLFVKKLKEVLPGKEVQVYSGLLKKENSFNKITGVLFFSNGLTVEQQLNSL